MEPARLTQDEAARVLALLTEEQRSAVGYVLGLIRDAEREMDAYAADPSEHARVKRNAAAFLVHHKMRVMPM